MTVVQKINLDMVRPTYQIVYSKTGDTNRPIEASLFQNGAEWDVPSGSTVKLRAIDQGGNKYTANGTFVDNVVSVTLPNISVRGKADTEIQITLGGEVVATFDFINQVYQSA